MAVVLSKNTKVILAKENPGLDEVVFGLYWEVPVMAGEEEADLDSSLFCLDNKDGKCRYERDLVGYMSNTEGESHLEHPSKAIIHSGDVKEGSSGGDKSKYCEMIAVKLSQVPAHIRDMVNVITINSKQTFKDVRNARVDLLDAKTKTVLYTYDLSEDGGDLKAMTSAHIYRDAQDQWRYEPVGNGFPGGLKEYCERYGVEVKG